VKTLILFIIVIHSSSIFAQKIDSNDTLKELNLYNFKTSAEWLVVKDEWKDVFFIPFLQKNNIQLNCETCTKVVLEVVFNIVKENQYTFEILKNSKCSQKFSKKEFKELNTILKKIKFPDGLSNKIFRVNLGFALKC
jgi:hypothetical protein